MTKEDQGLVDDLIGKCSLSLSKGMTNRAKFPVPELVEGEKGRVGEGASGFDLRLN